MNAKRSEKIKNNVNGKARNSIWKCAIIINWDTINFTLDVKDTNSFSLAKTTIALSKGRHKEVTCTTICLHNHLHHHHHHHLHFVTFYSLSKILFFRFPLTCRSFTTWYLFSFWFDCFSFFFVFTTIYTVCWRFLPKIVDRKLWSILFFVCRLGKVYVFVTLKFQTEKRRSRSFLLCYWMLNKFQVERDFLRNKRKHY